jgi:ATP-dependent Lhr-like helicase
MLSGLFHPCVSNWFVARFGVPTEAQTKAWPAIQQNLYTLIAAPTGSGKTLAAFLVAIDALVKKHISGNLLPQTEVLYVSPLKALGNDIERNLREPLDGITRELEKSGHENVHIKVSVRSGDTTASERSSMLRIPPHILVTTPESLYLLLTSEGGRNMLKTVKTLIIDEIHAMADDKRGSHLSLSLERLEHLTGNPLKRIGLSATQKPISLVASFLTGNRPETNCQIVDNLSARKYDMGLVLPHSPLSPVMSNEVWTEIHQKLVSLIQAHKTTLIFVNTRRLAERLTHSLDPFLEKDTITAHHGSMSKKHRESAEQRLKHGHLKALVATASLELGIDIGSVDLVIQISSPRSISAFVQRLGRSRHYVNGVPKGRLIPLTLNDLIECTALLHSVKKGELDTLHIPEKPVDVLAQQIVAEVSCQDYPADELYAIFKKAFPYRNLTLNEFGEIAETLSRGYTTRKGRGSAYIHYDRINQTLKPRRAARLTALINGGTIPDSFDFDVILEPQNTVVGTVHEDFATESLPGDVFQLGNSSWKIKKIENGKIRVEDAHGQPPDMPFWIGEAPGRSNELSAAVSQLILEIGSNLTGDETSVASEIERIEAVYQLDKIAAEQLVKYLAFTKAAFGVLPSEDTVILERFFDQAGDTHLVLHSVFGTRVNKAWGLALRKRFCRKFNFELQAAANENGIVLSLGPTHSFPLEEVFSYLNPANVREILIQALLDSPVFGVRWRWNASTALAITRRRGGKRVAPQIQRMQSEDLISLIFPDQLACPENLEGDRISPDHPLINQTLNDCLHEAMDLDGLVKVLEKIRKKELRTVAADLREPSPMAQEVLVAQPYAFLDNAPLEERRVHAVYSRRWNSMSEASAMAQLDEAAIAKVKEEVWPLVRNSDELYDALMVAGFLTLSEIEKNEDPDVMAVYMKELISDNRATKVSLPGNKNEYWLAVERLPEFRKIFPHLKQAPEIPIPEEITAQTEKIVNPLVEILRSRLDISGPVTVQEIGRLIPVGEAAVEQSFLALENEGFVFRGHFSPGSGEEWCERRLLARIHRYTIDKLRSEIKPVSPSEFMHYLFHWQYLISEERTENSLQLRKILDQLEGYEAQSVAWEGDIFTARIKSYSYTTLDLLLMTGEYVWGRFKNSKTEQQLSSIPIRTTPVTFIKRENLRHYLNTDENSGVIELSVYARTIFNLLKSDGALFFFQLEEKSKMFKSQIEDALIELVSVGLVTSDSFTGLRTLLIPDKYYTERRKGKIIFNLQQAGRWWLLLASDNNMPENTGDHSAEIMAMMLLKRYGVVFRKLAEKEKLLFLWYDMLKIYRKMEAQGTIRGGRFVDGFGGEQYALPEAVSAMRSLKKKEPEDILISISASDPLNLTGYITPGRRIAAFHGNRILYSKGSPVAFKEGKEIGFFGNPDQGTQWNLMKLLVHREVQPELRPYLAL